MKEIDLNALNENKFLYRDEQFADKVQIYNTGDSTELYGELEIKFKKCHFSKGIEFNLSDYSKPGLEKIRILFVDCEFNKEDNKSVGGLINAGKAGTELSLEFYNSFIWGSFRLDECDFSSLILSNNISHSSTGLHNSKLDSVTIQNSLGDYFLSNLAATKVDIDFDLNILLVDRLTNHPLIQKVLDEGRSLEEALLKFNNRYQIDGVRQLYISTQLSNEAGLKEEVIPYSIKNGKYVPIPKKNEKYYPSIAQLIKAKLEINIKFKQDIQTEARILGGYYNSISIERLNDASKLYIRDVNVNKFDSENIRKGFLEISKVRAMDSDSIFSIHKSDLSNTTIDNTDLRTFGIVNFYKSKLVNMVFTSTKFPKEIQALENVDYPDKKEEDYNHALYENYRQLKVAFDSGQNRIMALEMHRLMYKSIKKSPTLSLQDRIVLRLNDFTNAHGTSIMKAFRLFVILFLSLGLLFNLSILNLNPEYSLVELIRFDGSHLKFLWDNLSVFFILANPAHNMESLKTAMGVDELPGISFSISFLSRVLMAWAYYEFVAAFRKFGKAL